MTLAQQVAAARPGSAIRLDPGFYGDFKLEKPVSLIGSPETVFNTLEVNWKASPAPGMQQTLVHGMKVRPQITEKSTSASWAVRVIGFRGHTGPVIPVHDIIIDGLDIEYGRLADDAPSAIEPTDSELLPRPGQRIRGQYIGVCMGVADSYGVMVKNCKMAKAFHGLGIGRSSNLKVIGNRIGDIRTSPMTGASLINTLIQGNRLGPSHPWKWGAPGGHGDHADFIHIWTEVNYAACSKLGIIGNFMDQGDGVAPLGPYLDAGMVAPDGTKAPGFEDIVIEDNMLLNGNNQGFRLENVNRFSFKRNTMRLPGAGIAPSLILADGCKDGDIVGNVGADSQKQFMIHPGNTTIKTPLTPAEAAALRAPWS